MQTSAIPSAASSTATPAWVQDAVFYQIFPDRFARSLAVPKPANLEAWDTPPTLHGFKGGDLLGVADRLDYLSDLGITALYLCPIFRSTANHRYHTHDYYEVDPILGGNAALATLLSEAHRRNIRVVLDGVFNHTGRGFFQFNHILENGGASPYIDWFTVHSWPLHPYGPADAPAGYAAWWGDRALPELNTSNLEVREFLWRVGEYWIGQGIDGWRLDVPGEIDDDDFWRAFRHRVKSANSEAYIVGEIWEDARRWLQGDQFDAVMNYLFTKVCIGFFTAWLGMDDSQIRTTGLNPVVHLDARGFAGALDRLLGLYSWDTTLVQLNLLDSHDMARFLTVARGDESALRLAVLFQMTFPGAPCLYYGDEIGLSGGATVEEARGAFPWDFGRWNEGLRDHYKRCIELRRTHSVLRRGGFHTVWADGHVYVFERRLGDDRAFVALNAGPHAAEVDTGALLAAGAPALRPVFGDAEVAAEDGRVTRWRLASRSGAVLLSPGSA